VTKTFQFDVEEHEDFPLEINGETFMCVGDVDGLVLLRYYAVVNNPETRLGQKAAAVDAWFKQTILPSDYPKFEAHVQKLKLDIEDLSEVAGYLADCYNSVRPTEQAPSSPDGQEPTGQTSGGDSS
jgi:hypothetical protein